MNSPFSSLLIAIQNRIASQVTAVRWVDGDMGQLEGYEGHPPVSFPCVLVDFDGFTFDDAGEGIQIAEGSVILRLAFTPYSSTSNITPNIYKSKALEYFDIEWNLFRALHGWKPSKYGYLMRVSADTERRDDNIRVRQIRFSITYEDFKASPVRTLGSLPPNLGVENVENF